MVEREWQVISGIVQQGHQIASGRSSDRPYPQGSIEMQIPHFKALGLDLSSLFKGTLNVSIYPYQFTLKKPAYTFRQVHWTDAHPPEDFSFSPCQISFQACHYSGFIYYPHPETKQTHFQAPSVLEILAPPLPNICYGDAIELGIAPAEILLTQATRPE